MSEGGTLYATQFEEFTAGNNRWGGSNGWVSDNTKSGSQGIIQDPVKDLPIGKAGYLGYASPTSKITKVYRTINHDPVATGFPRIEFDTLLGVQDSTSTKRDYFYVSFYNIEGYFLAAIIFDNTTGMVLSDDGVTVKDTGVPFIRGDQTLGVAALQILTVAIDFDRNEWQASLDGIPLFSQAFTSIQKPLSLGPLAFEWDIPSGGAGQAGDNWLLVADLLVASIPPGPFEPQSFALNASRQAEIAWPGHSGFDYQVQYSPDMKSWKNDLPGSLFAANASEKTLSFTDPSEPSPACKFYRVMRTPTFP
ncbi:hypothetical protein [Luteolibacter luteus]|uniref:Uncharacterized protein n=1 Tax=Luteolibacter luteus TaxID=2728835 RepID=A0A858RCZ0_9BACT|nr:hypothetical protein [Luteolibacter luteus]QJE94259.1 hypothetical protein HHL09_00150 [Luteolibacter luteus]